MTLVWTALSLGAVYAIVAIGFNIVLTSSGIFNFALPQFVMLGTLLGYQGIVVAGITPPLVVAGCALVGALLGYAEERLAIRPLANAVGHGTLVTTVGAAVAIEGAAVVVWGTQAKTVPFIVGGGAFDLFGGRVRPVDLFLLLVAVGVGTAAHAFSRRTRWGLAARAATADPVAAQLKGVDVRRLTVLGFVIAGAFTAGMGPLMAAATSANSGIGHSLVIIGFVALSIGGIGSYLGALVGGMAVGFVQVMSTRYLGGEYALVVLFVVLLTGLLIKPTGILGDRQMRPI